MKKIIALALVLVMVLALCACGDKAEESAESVPVAAETAEAAPADVAAPATEEAPADGEASEEPSGEASAENGETPTASAYVAPDAKYSKDLEGYRQYVRDAYATDTNAPEDMKETWNGIIDNMTDPEEVSDFVMFGLICSYEDFLKA